MQVVNLKTVLVVVALSTGAVLLGGCKSTSAAGAATEVSQPDTSQRITLQAIVRDYLHDALRTRDQDPRFRPGTIIQIISPGTFFGKELIVQHPAAQGQDSVWRDSTTQMTISLEAQELGAVEPVFQESEIEVLSIQKGTQGTLDVHVGA